MKQTNLNLPSTPGWQRAQPSFRQLDGGLVGPLVVFAASVAQNGNTVLDTSFAGCLYQGSYLNSEPVQTVFLRANYHRLIVFHIEPLELPRPKRSFSQMMRAQGRGLAGAGLLAAAMLSGCSTSHYRTSADREVYKIVRDGERKHLGKTNAFTIDTGYSKRAPDSIQSAEIIQQRLMAEQRKVSLGEALKIAIENNRQYQSRKELLYLTALSLTTERYNFGPKFSGGATATGLRAVNADKSGELTSRLGVGQLLQSGASVSAAIVNDVLRYYTGDPRPTATTTMSINVLQPLLRGAGGAIVAENLKQSERNAIYEIRAYSHFQNTFAVDVVAAYYRLLQQKDAVRNTYNNYRNLVLARERAEALSKDRLPAFQVDQARQDELSSKSSYILAVESYKSTLDGFKNTLGLPIGVEISLDDAALEDLTKVGLLPVRLTETDGYEIAVKSRLDVLNEIDRFEDSKRKIKVTANALKADLNIFANASLGSEGPTDYTKFDLRNYRAGAGVQLNLPLDRLRERNAYRTALINFESQIRSLSLTLDGVRLAVRQGLRTLEQARQNYQIQQRAVELADRRVEIAPLLLASGRAIIRDQLEAQAAQFLAHNSLTQALVDYHVARLGLLINLGKLDTGVDHFWTKDQPVSARDKVPEAAPGTPTDDGVVPPEKLFGK